MKTLVTGATGFLGSAIARELISDGRAVKILVRHDADLSNVEGLELEFVIGDLRDQNSLEKALDGCDVLYHVAAHYSFWDKDKRKIYDINVGGTEKILRAALKKKINKVIYTSTVGCIGLLPDGIPGNEETILDPSTLCNDYKLSKFQAERLALGFNNKIPVVIVNPSAPIGPRDIKPTPTGGIVLDFLRGKIPAYLETGLNLIHVKDCARGHILAEQNGKPGDRYILGNKNMSLQEILMTLEKISGLKAPTIKIPYWLAYTSGWINDFISNFITHRAPVTPLGAVKMAKYKMFFDPSKAINELGLPQTPPEIALKEAVIWFQENGYIDKKT